MMSMVVTAIEDYRKNKYKIYLNDAFAFVLYKGDLRHYDITVGKTLREEDIDLIREEVLVKRARMRAMHLLQSRDYTEEAMRRKLKEGLYPADICEDAISYVKHYHYVDDTRYARSYIEAHASAQPAGQIVQKLRQKGIDKETVMAAFADYEEEHGVDREERELQILKDQMVKKMRGGEHEDRAAREKLFAAFYRRGFSLSMIEKAYAQIMDERI